MIGSTLIEGIANAFARGDANGLSALYESDAVLHHPLIPEPVRGRAAIAAAEEGLFASYSDHAWEATTVVIDGRAIAVRYVLRLTNTKPMPTRDGLAPATGKRLEFHGASFFRLSDRGLVEEEYRYAATEGLRFMLGFEAL